METNTIETTTAAIVEEDYVGVPISDGVRIIFIIVGTIYSLVGVVGNIFIIVTIFSTRTMRNPHYFFIVNLATADLLVTGYVIPHAVLSLMIGRYPAVNLNHCIFNGFMTAATIMTSLLSLMAISINRYLNVCQNHLFSRIFANKTLSSIVGCASVWILAFTFALPALHGWGRFVFDRKTHYCGYDRTYSFSYTLFLLLFTIGIPVSIVFACNIAIWRFVRKASHRIYSLTRARNLDHHQQHQHPQQQQRQQQKQQQKEQEKQKLQQQQQQPGTTIESRQLSRNINVNNDHIISMTTNDTNTSEDNLNQRHNIENTDNDLLTTSSSSPAGNGNRIEFTHPKGQDLLKGTLKRTMAVKVVDQNLEKRNTGSKSNVQQRTEVVKVKVILLKCTLG